MDDARENESLKRGRPKMRQIQKDQRNIVKKARRLPMHGPMHPLPFLLLRYAQLSPIAFHFLRIHQK